MKIVEAMSAGRAIVSTSLGWEGLAHLEPGRQLLVADEPRAFADAAAAAAAAIRRCARGWPPTRATLAEREYDWRGAGRPARAGAGERRRRR